MSSCIAVTANFFFVKQHADNCPVRFVDGCYGGNAFDPTFASVSDSRNNSYLGRGISLEKYTGSRGKLGASDSNAEFMSSVVRMLDKNRIPWQTGELGKVDAGGGGTISYIMDNMGMVVLDCAVPVLSMAAPFEVMSKIDLYYTYLAYRCFVENA